MKPRSNLRFYAAGIALAVAAGATLLLRHGTLPQWALYLAALLLVAAAGKLYFRKPIVPTTRLDPNTRRYARAMYHNGYISMEELVQFYVSHPE